MRTNPVIRNMDLLPTELKNEPIWLLAADDAGTPNGVDDKGYSLAKIPCIITDSGLLQRFSNNMGHKAMSYDFAMTYAKKYGYDIGILMTDANHYTVIDLDAKKLTDTDVFNKRMVVFTDIISKSDSYTEQSSSGEGYHIIVKSDILIARNFRQHGIEIYSYRERFMLCTGNKVSTDSSGIVNDFEAKTSVILNSVSTPIGYRESIINSIVTELGSTYEEHGIILVEEVPKKSDESIIDEILQSTFADSFLEISTYTVNTDYTATRYPSGSEASMNVISILCRFTDSNSQIRRMFLALEIAKRDKYTKNDYHIDRCLTIARSDQDLSQVNAFIQASVNLYQLSQKDILNRRIEAESKILDSLEDYEDDGTIEDLTIIESEYEADIADFADIPIPHGLIGEIVQYSLDSSPLKLKVAAVAAALASISAIVGRQYRYRGSSLNNYFVVIGYSTMGKESASSTISAVAKALAANGGDAFFCFDKLASGQALPTLMRNAKFGSVTAMFPEFALLVEQLKNGNNSAMSGLKAELLDVFSKNKTHSRYGGSKHAKKEDEREGMESPAFTFVGDTTPDFYDGVTEEMASGGFMSRLILLSHDGTTKKMSDPYSHLVTLKKETIDGLNMLVQQVISKYNSNTFMDVGVTDPLVKVEVANLEEYLRLKFNKSKDEAHRQVFGRAFLKVMTVASLFAASYNLGNPTISMEDFIWARGLIMRDVFITVHKLNSGEIGVSEETCKRRVSSLFDKLLKNPKQRDKLAKGYAHVLDLGVMPRSLLSQRLQGNSFKIGQLSNTKTLEAVLDNMIKNGEIKVVTDDKKTILSNYTGRSVRGMCYESTEAYFDKPLDAVADWLKEVGKETLVQYL